MSSIYEVVAEPGALESLQHLAAAPETSFSRDELEDRCRNLGARRPDRLLDQFLTHDLLRNIGSNIGISTAGRRAALILEALQGGDIESIFLRIKSISGVKERYELVREGMTNSFIGSLVESSGFGRLYFCSPWINPSDRDCSILKYACLTQAKRGNSPEILVITRTPETPEKELSSETGLTVFKSLGAKIFSHQRLHSKLYIREPGQHGGTPMAVLGSQNLTRSSHLELGIRITGDSRLIDDLIRYFLEISNYSVEKT